MKISSFLVAVLVVSLFTTLFGIYYADIATDYEQTFDNSTFAGYNQLTTIKTDLEEINQTITSINQESGVVDLLGGFLASGFDVLKITFNSFGAFGSMIESAFSQLPLGYSMSLFKTYFVAIAFILFVFAIVAVLVGREI